jgi:flagellar hook-associated protein 3 FlgL
MRLTNAMVSRNVLQDINASADRLNRTRSKASSGKALDRPSDDPAAVAQALKLRASLDGTQQQQRNANDALSFTEVTEQGLAALTDVLQRARELVVQGGTDSSDTNADRAIAAEMRQLISAAKEAGNTSFAGRFVFGGTQTTSPPYPLTASPPSLYAGDSGRIAREIGPGVSVVVNQPGSAVLGTGAPGDLLDVMQKIVDHLDAGDHAALRTTDIKALDAGFDGVMGARAENGALTQRIEAGITRLGQVEETTMGQLSKTEDVDLASVMISLSTQQTAYESALKSGANIVQASLMDFLR